MSGEARACAGPECEGSVTSANPRAKYCSKRCAGRADRARNPEYYEAHREERKAYLKNYYQENRVHLNAASAAYAEEHQDEVAKFQAEWREANRDRIASTRAVWREANGDRIRMTMRAWSRQNPEAAAVYARARRHLKRGTASAPITKGLLNTRRAYLGTACWICREHTTKLTWDHVKPLSKGGAHMLSNLRLACASCNSRKNAKWYGIEGLPRLVDEVRLSRLGVAT